MARRASPPSLAEHQPRRGPRSGVGRTRRVRDVKATAVVIDASAFVEMLVDTELGAAVAARLRDHRLATPAHFDGEVLSALGRLSRAGKLPDRRAAHLVRR